MRWYVDTIELIDSAPGREVATGRKVAIKKIKVGQFKDGLDMSAIREVKYLRELKHRNVIEVRGSDIDPCDLPVRRRPASRCILFEDEPQPSARVS